MPVIALREHGQFRYYCVVPERQKVRMSRLGTRGADLNK